MNIGHNERSFRLETIAQEAKAGLNRVEVMEGEVIEGWLDYGKALNEGRALFPSDKEFGQWMRDNLLHQLVGVEVNDMERLAAMWGAANAEQLAEAREASNARTLRGLHAKWKEIEAEREAQAKRAEEEQRRAEEAKKAPVENTVASPADTVRPWGEDAADDVEQGGESDFIAPAPSGGEAPADEPEGKSEPIPDPYGYAKLTEDALLETANGLKEQVDELKAKVNALKGEVEVWKDRHREATEGDMGATVSNLQKRVAAANYKRDEAMAAAKRMEYRMKKALKRVEELENAIVPL